MNDHNLKCETEEKKFKPTPLTERLAENEKLLEDSLALAGLIRAALMSADSLEIPHRPVSNIRDLVDLNREKLLVLSETLSVIAATLGVREVR